MFTTSLVLESDPAPDFWLVRSPLVWVDGTFGTLIAPVGFRTDLASIPRTLRNLPAFDPCGKSRKAAVMHDALYSLGQSFGKERADNFLRAAMIAEGCSVIDADAFFDAVKWFGHYAWVDDGKRSAVSYFDPPDMYTEWVKHGGTILAGLAPSAVPAA